MAQHFSFRVPWHENRWDGSVCRNPSENYSCMRLKGINQAKDESLEKENAGCELCDLSCMDKIPCIREGATFMCDKNLSVTVNHPYSTWSEHHKHLKPLEESFPPYSYPARPFRWVMRRRFVGNGQYKFIDELAEQYGFRFEPDYEPVMNNKTWVQDGRNQEAIFNAFFSGVEEDKSICVFYAKQVPFIEDARRVVIGIGNIRKVLPPIKYDMTDPDGMTSCAWENIVCHSIRNDMQQGFLLPYNDLMAYAEEHTTFDIREATVFAEEEYFEEFSYASEHLSHDAVIDVILQCLKVVEMYKKCKIPGDWDQTVKWLNEQLVSVWEDRGAFPGLGAVLAAFGIPSGPVVARELKDRCEEKDIWDILDAAIDSPAEYLSELCSDQINGTIQNAWKNYGKEGKTYIRLLSRINLTIDQARAVLLPENREKHGINISENDVICNPYLLYEHTRNREEAIRISIKKVDHAFYPPEYISKEYPVENPSAMESEIDPRRVRALAVSILEKSALEGNTIMPVNNLVLAISDQNIDPKCPVGSHMMDGMQEYLSVEMEIKKDAFDHNYYKLVRYKKIDHLILTQVRKRVKSSNRHISNTDWRENVDEVCNRFPKNPDEKTEEAAREEKAAALKVLSEARLSVLIGGAGTGKTTVLEILCSDPAIQNGGILLLAPTGKARVRMSQGLRGKVNFKAKTLAQFLINSKRYDPKTFSYKILTPMERQKVRADAVAKTVIIDESSMITEDMFGALIDATTDAERIIFVGDDNQLPPIGAGRPFVDLVRYLKSVDNIGEFPVTGMNYAKLTVTNRQMPEDITKKIRSDVRLAQWYAEDARERDEDIFSEIQAGTADNKVVFKQWHDKDELEQTLYEMIRDVAHMQDIDDVDGFSISMGGVPHHNDRYDGLTFFNLSKGKSLGCVTHAEDWQVLSPVRNKCNGVLHLNHIMHEKYRQQSMVLSNDGSGKIPKKMGTDGIVYGDKVINVVNQKRTAYPEETADNYVANGEIGMACGGWGQNKYLHIEYSSQPGYNYSYTEKDDFGDEGANPLELAYALTVHKSQGSQFKAVIVVLSDKCFLMSRELLYTALTRQKDQLIILYDEEAYNLKKYSSSEYSDIAQRYTDLFEQPRIVEVNNKYYEENLIHRAKNGIMVRSKSEVIIANMLCDNGITDFLYEEKLVLGDTYKLPDFTFKDAASGSYIIWEHLGMLGREDYRTAWEEKKKLYAAYGFSEENMNLIITMDSPDGGIDSQIIQDKIEEYLM